MKRIAVLTSGGDSPGMNACIANLFTLATRQGMKLFAVRRGYAGLIEGDIALLTEVDVKNTYSIGGSIIKTARSKEFLTDAGQQKAIAHLNKAQIDTLIVIGGNGSFRGAQELSEKGVKVIAIPGTIDNDLNFSTRSLGFDTAVHNSVNAIDKIKDTMLSNDRGSVIEVMGRNSGDIALYSAAASNADAVVVKEVEETKNNVIEAVKRAINRGIQNPTVIIAENILNAKELAKALEEETGKVFKTTVIGYIQRGGSPTVFDRNFAMALAVKAIKLINENNSNKAIGQKDGKIYTVELKDVLTRKTNFNFQLYELFNKLNG